MDTTFARPQFISIKTQTYEIDNRNFGQSLNPSVKLGLSLNLCIIMLKQSYPSKVNHLVYIQIGTWSSDFLIMFR